MTINKNKSLLLLTIIAALGLTACTDNKAENAGEKIDKVMSDAGNAVEDAGDSIKDAATDAGNAVEDACEDVKEGLKAKDQDC
ncbi:hypothetical protein [Pseudocolwellia agarivorans]|uniref:hypothetical protein n=1 Tax=Pseudocolwellia agarivorans TaxID=1911682 RepID=UPI00098795F3|nr:hypothetical protein [Pseudocolwellia agarivorans]